MPTQSIEHAVQANKTALLFPGQGSQKAGMLAELAESFSVIGQTFSEASAAVGFDLWQIAQSGDGLDQTQNTQPVLLTASVALWRLWLELGGVVPKYLVGHSLGEYSALVAAEAITLSDAVKLVHLRGQLMQAAVASGEGAMAAILGLDDAQVLALCAQVSQPNAIVEAANFNAKGQVVVAGHAAAVQDLIVAAKAQGAKAIALPVSVPSHCTLMQSAAEQLSQALAEVAIQMPKIAVIQNVNAQVAQDVNALRDALTAQLYQPVQWTQSMQVLQQHGICWVAECGPGTVLSNLAKRLEGVEKAFALDNKTRFEDGLSSILMAEGQIA